MKTLLPLLSAVIFISCFQHPKPKEKSPSPAGYDLDQPDQITLGYDLREISGIRFDDASQEFIAVNDEQGRLFRVNQDGKVSGQPFKFAGKGDFEDVDYDGIFWYVLKSNGDVLRIADAFSEEFSTRAFPFHEKSTEFESICFDKSKNKLFIIAKANHPFIDGRIPAYVLDTTSGKFTYEPEYSPDTLGISKMMGKKKTEFKPTAAAIHPLTGELFITSVNDRLLVVMKNGEVNNVFKLSKKHFRQPEGICFSANGDLYISNEAGEGTANILRFVYRP